jgi:tetratricopeptide (TPR) repeat protein
MHKFTGILLIILALLGNTVTAQEELKKLQELGQDEGAFIDALRVLKKEQLELAEQELSQYQKLQNAGSSEAAQEMMKKAQSRVMLAKDAYQLGIRLFGSSARMHNYYGEFLYDELHQTAAALKEWNTAISLDSKLSAAYNNLGIHYFHVGQYSMGLSNLDNALKLDPRNPDYLYNMAQMYLIHAPQIEKQRNWSQKKIYREAMKCSKEAASQAEGDYDLLQDYAVNFSAAENFGLKANWKQAAMAWQKARPHARNPAEVFYTWLNEARSWSSAGQSEKAIAALEGALEVMPGNEVALRLLRKEKRAS